MSLYLVTGGAGFIGSHLVDELLRRGRRVRVLDNFLTGKRENLAAVARDVEVLEGDLRDPEACRRAAAGAEVVLHQAALPSVPRSVADPRLANDINVSGTLNILLAARDAGARRFVFASSSAVYGDSPELPKREGHEGRPLSPYAVSKFVGEKYAQVFHVLYGLSTVSLRYFNVFGPRQDPASQYAAVVPLFVTRLLRGEPPAVFGDGEQSRDFTYVADVVSANLLAAETTRATGEVLNVACGEGITVNRLAAEIASLLGSRVTPVHGPERPGDIKHSLADISKAGEALWFVPRTTLREGLEKTVAWYRERSAR
ncbi:MAG: SDR family oxidoreductase [Candidatus Aminicenantes bacterium]|nr:SDR family oxidoreductase [Candidatus Aminicenantes bacterium]